MIVRKTKKQMKVVYPGFYACGRRNFSIGADVTVPEGMKAIVRNNEF